MGELRRTFPDISVRVLRGKEATVTAVREALEEKPWDVLHYAGHAFFKKRHSDRSGLKLFDGTFTASELASTEVLVPPLVFLNACESARVRDDDLPPPEDAKERADLSLAEGILRAGARTLLGNFWKVLDTSASDLARVVYEELSKGAPVGKAMLRGRRKLFDAQDSSWASYLL